MVRGPPRSTLDRSSAASDVYKRQGLQGVLRYSKPFEAQMVEQVLANHDGVIDFGASNSVYDDKDLFARVENTLAPYPNVILLLPSPSADESLEILNNRLTLTLTAAGREFTNELFELNKYFICLLYTSDAADERSSVDLGGRRIIKQKKQKTEKKKENNT